MLKIRVSIFVLHCVELKRCISNMNNIDCRGMSTSQLNLLKEELDCNLE
jgi:hypothetical protein